MVAPVTWGPISFLFDPLHQRASSLYKILKVFLQYFLREVLKAFKSFYKTLKNFKKLFETSKSCKTFLLKPHIKKLCLLVFVWICRYLSGSIIVLFWRFLTIIVTICLYLPCLPKKS